MSCVSAIVHCQGKILVQSEVHATRLLLELTSMCCAERDEPIAAHQNAPYDTETYPVTLIDRKEYANGITLSALILLSMPQTEILQRAITVHGDKVGAYAQQTNRALRVQRPSQLTQVGSGSAKP